MSWATNSCARGYCDPAKDFLDDYDTLSIAELNPERPRTKRKWHYRMCTREKINHLLLRY
ncbi:hypothetical protein SCA6_000212 [Theobroma cacao]